MKVATADICPFPTSDICPVKAAADIPSCPFLSQPQTSALSDHNADICPVSTEYIWLLRAHLGWTAMISIRFYLELTKWNTEGAAGGAAGTVLEMQA